MKVFLLFRWLVLGSLFTFIGYRIAFVEQFSQKQPEISTIFAGQLEENSLTGAKLQTVIALPSLKARANVIYKITKNPIQNPNLDNYKNTFQVECLLSIDHVQTYFGQENGKNRENQTTLETENQQNTVFLDTTDINISQKTTNVNKEIGENPKNLNSPNSENSQTERTFFAAQAEANIFLDENNPENNLGKKLAQTQNISKSSQKTSDNSSKSSSKTSSKTSAQNSAENSSKNSANDTEDSTNSTSSTISSQNSSSSSSNSSINNSSKFPVISASQNQSQNQSLEEKQRQNPRILRVWQFIKGDNDVVQREATDIHFNLIDKNGGLYLSEPISFVLRSQYAKKAENWIGFSLEILDEQNGLSWDDNPEKNDKKYNWPIATQAKPPILWFFWEKW